MYLFKFAYLSRLPLMYRRFSCSEVTRRFTKLYGMPFAVLNMANARRFGGGYVEGAGAQEENMFRRTGIESNYPRRCTKLTRVRC